MDSASASASTHGGRRPHRWRQRRARGGDARLPRGGEPGSRGSQGRSSGSRAGRWIRAQGGITGRRATDLGWRTESRCGCSGAAARALGGAEDRSAALDPGRKKQRKWRGARSRGRDGEEAAAAGRRATMNSGLGLALVRGARAMCSSTILK